jgi:DNA-binding transcriptional MerR regulator
MGLIQSMRSEFEKYRYYDAANVERLKQIMVLRKMQIPIKDIIRIYESDDMSVVVKAFVNRINTIDEEVNALSELKRIVNEFLQIMLQNGINKISALPLLYEEMDKQVDTFAVRKPINYEELNTVNERLVAPVDICIIDLPAIRVLSSKDKYTGISDVEDFWTWMGKKEIAIGLPGRHEMFEFQNDSQQTIFIQKIDSNFVNDGPFEDYYLNGGLFAVSGR